MVRAVALSRVAKRLAEPASRVSVVVAFWLLLGLVVYLVYEVHASPTVLSEIPAWVVWALGGGCFVLLVSYVLLVASVAGLPDGKSMEARIEACMNCADSAVAVGLAAVGLIVGAEFDYPVAVMVVALTSMAFSSFARDRLAKRTPVLANSLGRMTRRSDGRTEQM